jgi:synapsin
MSVIEDIPVTDMYKMWVDECAQAMGGLDICSLDFLHSKDGKAR